MAREAFRRERRDAKARGSSRAALVMDGPFAETKEIGIGHCGVSPGDFAAVNGLRMYYEVHGEGRPLVLLHGGLGHIDMGYRELIAELATERQVIAIEQQAHGRTADIDRTLSCARMADDTAQVLRQLDVRDADLFGFSAGGTAALQLAMQDPARVRKLVVVSSGYGRGGYTHAAWRFVEDALDDPMVAPQKRMFERYAAQPGQWSRAAQRLREVCDSQRDAQQDDLRRVAADTLFVTAECGAWPRAHAYELARVMPSARVVCFDGNDHDPAIIGRAAALVPAFLAS